MRVFYIIALLTVLFSSPLFAQKQIGIFSPNVVLVTATYERIYEFKEYYAEIYLGKELSYNYFYSRPYNKIFQYSITAKFLDDGVWMESCLLLPEIGNWSVVRAEKKSQGKYTLARDIKFLLMCEIYDSTDVIYSEYSPLQGDFKIEYKGNIYASSNWYCEYYGNRPSTENLCHIRYARRSLYHQNTSDKKFEILLAPDTYDDSPIRTTDHYDDLFFYHNDHTKDNHPADFTCFIVPRIFFVKFEESSLSIDIMDDHSPIRFTIIVQQFENPEKTIWNYHRLEIVREESAHEIQINDLGPLPRSEWAPGWPDPATTPLWQEPESACAQCE